jgi:hypothetical protein
LPIVVGVQRLVPLVLAALLVLAGCGQAPAGSTPSEATAETTTSVSTTAESTPVETTTSAPDDGNGEDDEDDNASTTLSDPATDRLGWENGYWHNESISVTRSDGLNETELGKVVNRSMARVEYVRGLEFERTVPVEIVTRSEFRNQTRSRNTTEANRLHQNVKWEAMFMVNESTNAIRTQQSNTGAGVGGYYSPGQDRIVIVSDNETSPEMNEITLAQELFHALQEREFNVSRYNQTTVERHNARDGIIEGDGNYVDHRYQQRCEAEWDCLMPQGGQSAGGGDIHLGLYQVRFQPYSDGVVFVRDRYRDGGWDAVNAVYENPPASTEQTIHPERYPQDEPSQISIADRSDDRWRVLELGHGVNYAEFGEAGLFVMLWYPSYVETQRTGSARNVVIPYAAHLNFTADRSLDPLDPFNYDHPATAGWDGDKLLPYVTDDSAATNETGYVWKTSWDTERDATEFRDAYVQLLEHHGAERVSDAQGDGTVFRIAEGAEFADAYRVTVTGDTVTITNAPTVEELSGVRRPA